MTTKNQTVAYIRVSSGSQSTARQRESIGEVDRVFEEKVSGGSREGRDQLTEMIKYVREGDRVIVASMDRLGRDVDDLKKIIAELNGKGVDVHLQKEGLKFDVNGGDTAMTDLMLHLLGGVAQFERARIRERQQEGIDIAKAQGKFAKAKKLSDQQITEAAQRIADGDTRAEVARDLGVSRQTLWTALKTI